MIQPPKVIFLDAVGTLFGVKGSVGQVYAEMAQRFRVEVSTESLNKAFVQSFQAAPPLLFSVKPEEIPKYEFQWWQAIAQRTFQEAGVLQEFSDFSSFFAELYKCFATAEPWFVYPDVRPALKHWQQVGIELGVLSNFDSRLYSVLQAFSLTQFFSSVTISTEVGAAKPSPQIFAAGLKKHQCTPELAWHIGDSLKDDYQGAKAAGLKAIWLNRTEK